jgi:hypothetical protein
VAAVLAIPLFDCYAFSTDFPHIKVLLRRLLDESNESRPDIALIGDGA